jgi:hypothetical protein
MNKLYSKSKLFNMPNNKLGPRVAWSSPLGLGTQQPTAGPPKRPTAVAPLSLTWAKSRPVWPLVRPWPSNEIRRLPAHFARAKWRRVHSQTLTTILSSSPSPGWSAGGGAAGGSRQHQPVRPPAHCQWPFFFPPLSFYLNPAAAGHGGRFGSLEEEAQLRMVTCGGWRHRHRSTRCPRTRPCGRSCHHRAALATALGAHARYIDEFPWVAALAFFPARWRSCAGELSASGTVLARRRPAVAAAGRSRPPFLAMVRVSSSICIKLFWSILWFFRFTR